MNQKYNNLMRQAAADNYHKLSELYYACKDCFPEHDVRFPKDMILMRMEVHTQDVYAFITVEQYQDDPTMQRFKEVVNGSY